MPPEIPLVSTLGGVGVLAVVIWIIWRQLRQDKTGADAQVDATALALLKEMRAERSEIRAERAEVREELTQVRERVAILEEDKRRHADVLQRHALWDTRAIGLLQQQDPTSTAALGDPPPLYPQGA
jgi:hypothetical protein